MRPQLGLTVGHGDLIGADLLAELKRRGVSVIRLEAKPSARLWHVAALCQEVIEAGLQPLFIAQSAEQVAVVPDGTLLEAGNEPDIERFGWTVPRYTQFVDTCIPVLQDRGLRMYAGVVSNPHARGLNFLRSLPWERWPSPTISVSWHRYPDGRSATTPHQPSASRAEEVYRVRDIVDMPMADATRPMAITEVGYHTGVGGWSETEAGENLRWERDFFASQGVELVCAYGINDGPDRRDHEQNYGMRRFDGTWKPTLNLFTGVPDA